MIAAIYARKSTDDSDKDEEARSTARQIDRATKYAAAKDWTVDPRYIFTDEDISGAEWKHRPGFNALLAALDETPPPFGVVVVSEVSRIGRDTVQVPLMVRRIEEAGVEIHAYLRRRRVTLADETGEVEMLIDSLLASRERRVHSDRAMDTALRRWDAGAVVGGGVFGYRNVRQGKGFVYRQIDEEQAAIVLRIFELYASGHGLTRIAKRLNGDRVPPPTPRRGAPVSAGWSVPALREIIRRRLYIGEEVWGMRETVYRRGTQTFRVRPETEWKKRDAPELRIIPESLWRAVQERRARAASAIGCTRNGHRRGRPPGADLVSPYLLSGIAMCAACGGSLVAFAHSRGPRGNRRRVKFYGCIRHARRGNVICQNDVMIRQETLNAAFLDALAEAIDERLITRAIEKAVARLQRRADAPDPRAALVRERTEIEASMRHLVDAVKRGRATDTLLSELAAQEERGKTIARRLAELDGRLRAVPKVDVTLLTARLTALGRDLRGTLASGGPDARRLLQRVLNGRRVACEAFREPGRRGYRFHAAGIPYAGAFDDMRSPTRLASHPRR
jgi:DNA invertase Pin-like site-specific DNA recombinase